MAFLSSDVTSQWSRLKIRYYFWNRDGLPRKRSVDRWNIARQRWRADVCVTLHKCYAIFDERRSIFKLKKKNNNNNKNAGWQKSQPGDN